MTSASSLSWRRTLASKGFAGSNTKFERRFHTPASHAFETRARNVSTIRGAGVLSMAVASKGIEGILRDRIRWRTCSVVMFESCSMALYITNNALTCPEPSGGKANFTTAGPFVSGGQSNSTSPQVMPPGATALACTSAFSTLTGICPSLLT
jgi:hypothetical protein